MTPLTRKPPADSSARVDAPRLGVPSRLLGATFHIMQRWPVIVLCMATLGLATLCFPPIGLWPLSYLCLVPWAVCVCTVVRSAWLYAVSYLLGVAFFAINVYWLSNVTGLGYAALCVWFGLAFPLVAWPVRHLFRRFGAPASLTLPVAWTAIEYLRGQTLAGFPWFYLAHSHFTVPHMIQIADFSGAYGVSFVIALVNGGLTDLMIQPLVDSTGLRARRLLRLPLSAGLTAAAVVATYLYGSLRLSEAASAASPGPRVAILQQDFPLEVWRIGVDTQTAFDGYMTLARQAVREHPDLIVMPETAWMRELNVEFLEASTDDLEAIRSRIMPSWTLANVEDYRESCRRAARTIQQFVDQTGVAVVAGAAAMQWRGSKTPQRVERFNSSYLFQPGKKRDAARYDKIHLVLFGEFVPFRYTSLHGLYERLNRLTPYGASGVEYSLTFGERCHAFSVLAPTQQRTYRFATPICYEDTVADTIRPFVRGPAGDKAVEFLLNLSNDGWFDHSGELEQHLAASVFRAVEFRVPIARAVNTGISAFVDSTGRTHDRVELTDRQRVGMAALDEALAALGQAADAAARRKTAGDADLAAISSAYDLIQKRITAALSGMAATAPASGPSDAAQPPASEFDFLRGRLGELLVAAARTQPRERASAWNALAAQARDDRETLARWKRAPQTAPGYRVCSLTCDARYSLYAQWGDWFATACVVLTAAMLCDWFVHRLRRPSRRQRRRLAKAAKQQGTT